MSALPVTFADVLAAREFLGAYLRPTPLVEREAVSAALGIRVLLKCENLLPTAAFKVRGGLNLLGRDPTAKSGVIAASTGNHGQSLAYAGKRFGIPVTIVAPRGANPLKLAAMRGHGATLVEHGVDFDEARVECERLARERGLRYVHSGNEPYLIAGVATASLEVLEERPDVDVLIVPVGGGSGLAGACIVAKHVRPSVRVIGVQSEGAPSAYLTWRDRERRETEAIRTFAEGLATRAPFDLPQRILAALLDDFVLVSDEDLYRAMRLLLVEGHIVAEGAGAAASTGNHGQSLAYAGKRFGIPVTIVAPRGANPLKLAAMRAHGATLVEHGVDFDEARVECERLARERGLRYVHSGNEPYLIAGVATASLEVLEERPDVDVLIVPVGGGSGLAGACIVAKHVRPSVRVIGVQSEGAPSAYLTWRDRERRETEAIRTFAEGLATRAPFDLPQRILAALLDDFVLVSDEDLYRAMRLLLVEGHIVAEGAGAAATAAAAKVHQALEGKTVALWISGGNATAESLTRALTAA